MNKKWWVILAACLAVLGYLFLRHRDHKVDANTSSQVLNPGVREKIVVNPDKHTLDIITANKVDHLFLPDRPSSIEINKNGTINVTSKQWGTELHAFIGLQASDAFRVAAGADLFYYKKLDLGLGVAGEIGNHTPIAFTGISYTVWGNLRAGMTFDTGLKPGVFVSVRF